MKRERLIKEIKNRIIKGIYKPGSPLNEKEMCKEFGISRTPYREAMFQLQADGLVEISHKKGIFAASMDLNTIRDIFEMRRILESVAARMAFKRINSKQLEKMKTIKEEITSLSEENDFSRYLELDKAFHDVIYEAQGNEVLKSYLGNLRDQCIRSWNCLEDKTRILGITSQSIRDISKIYDAFVDQDPETVERLISEHFSVYLRSIAGHLLDGLGAELTRDIQNI